MASWVRASQEVPWSIRAPLRSPVPVVSPHPPPGTGPRCLAPTDIMIPDHPSLINHQRDATVRAGIRTRQFSLKECIACHAVAGADGKPVTYDNPNHFCRVCHDYTAVRIDCFACHASIPDEPAPLAMLPHTIRPWCTG